MDKTEESILALISQYPEGLSTAEILSLSKLEISERTLNRRLDALIERNLVIRLGQTRAIKYILMPSQDEGDTGLAHVPISKEAKRVKNYLTLPVNQRKSVGYNRSFLDDYNPNSTYYLSEEMRAHLEKIGKQPDGHNPAGTFARNIFDRLLIDLSFNSSQLEGNTYSLLETQRLLMHGEISAGKSAEDAQMILNHKAAIEFLVETGEALAVNRFTIFNLHALLADNLLANQRALGNIRKIPVGIGKAAYKPLDIPQLLEECLNQILEKAAQIKNVFEQSFFLLVHIPYLQAFEDVNKRTSRLAANIPLIKNNYCPLSFVGVNKQDYVDSILGVYELNDVSLLAEFYVWLYEHSVKRYTTIREQMPKPDRFRIRYRQEIINLVKIIVERMILPDSAEAFIQAWVKDNIAADDQARFKDDVESDIMSLHEGNIVRFKIGVRDFQKWAKAWKLNKQKR